MSHEKELRQHLTPAWICDRLIDAYFADLTPADCVVEPSCGDGRFLQAIPLTIPAVGVEIDPTLAGKAQTRTGRRVIVGDFCAVEIDVRPTAIIGNPPFQVELIMRFLDRAHKLLPEEGRVGFILPAYAFQTTNNVIEYARRWSIRADMIPRDCFHRRMQVPLVFANFTKQTTRTLIGFALYFENAAVQRMHKSFQEILDRGRPYRSVWRAVVDAALEYLGGEADLQHIYRIVEGARPTDNPFWKDKVRQIVQRDCVRVGPARYRIAA